jgi:hypothetical protein
VLKEKGEGMFFVHQMNMEQCLGRRGGAANKSWSVTTPGPEGKGEEVVIMTPGRRYGH